MVVHTQEQLFEYLESQLGEDCEELEDIIMYEGMESAVVGVAVKDDLPPCLIYDYWRLVDQILKTQDVELEDALIYVESEMANAYHGDHSPIVIKPCRRIAS